MDLIPNYDIKGVSFHTIVNIIVEKWKTKAFSLGFDSHDSKQPTWLIIFLVLIHIYLS